MPIAETINASLAGNLNNLDAIGILSTGLPSNKAIVGTVAISYNINTTISNSPVIKRFGKGLFSF
jgi:hypothetical protein